MNLRGERFISHTEFIRYCKDLNVHTYESELEHFEKIGEMLPVARVNFPQYDYWQVHQLYSVQQALRKNEAPQYLALEDRPRYSLDFNRATADIDAKMRSNFDALSFWITMYRRERQRAFANVPDKYGVKRLDDSRYADNRKRLRNHAGTVIDRFGLGRDGLYRFLYRLVELYESYRKNERYKLADELSQDVFDLQRLIELSLCDDFDRISDELRRISTNGAEGWSARGFKLRDAATTFRHLDIATKERDYARDLIARVSARSSADLEKLECQDWSFTSDDAKGLLAYCEQEGLGLLLTALGGMSAVGEEEYRHNFRRVQMYTNLKNALTSYEYLLKSLGEKGGYKVGTTLGSAIPAAMSKQPWFALYIKKVNSTLVRANSEEEFFCNLEKLQKDRELQRTKKDGYWARMFLITHLARNAAVHLYPKGDRYFADPFGATLHAVVNAACYTWKLAQSENWLPSESSDGPK